MQSPVKFKKMGHKFRVYFSYNSDLVEIMREHEGWWVRSDKAWQFPIGLFDDLYDELTSKKYRVKIIKDDVKKKVFQKPSDSFSNPDVVAVYGKCLRCGRGGFIGRDGLCSECRAQS